MVPFQFNVPIGPNYDFANIKFFFRKYQKLPRRSGSERHNLDKVPPAQLTFHFRVINMFKFGFNGDDHNNEGEQAASTPSESEGKQTAVRITPDENATPLQDLMHHFISLCNDEVTIRKSEARAPNYLSPLGADIVPHEYEGGYKLWEGAIDLAEYLHHNHLHDQSILNDRSALLELGAGHSIPSIVAARCGVSDLTLQDYNEDVIRDVTIPNIRANCPNTKRTEFCSGAWQALPTVLERQFDVILSAETVYAHDQVQALAECIVNLLRIGGVAFVAGKSYYFGVGGGMRAFEAALVKFAAALNINVHVERVHEVRDGVSNVREIVKLTRIH